MELFVLSYNQEAQKRFNVSKEEAGYVMNWLKHIVIEDIFGGLWVNKTMEQFVSGYEDSYQKAKKNY